MTESLDNPSPHVRSETYQNKRKSCERYRDRGDPGSFCWRVFGGVVGPTHIAKSRLTSSYQKDFRELSDNLGPRSRSGDILYIRETVRCKEHDLVTDADRCRDDNIMRKIRSRDERGVSHRLPLHYQFDCICCTTLEKCTLLYLCSVLFLFHPSTVLTIFSQFHALL